jgi:UTP--glucose-1-phosphate uridylyltransferase
MRVDVRTAIVPLAGQGERLLPATRSIPPALLPVLDTPLLQFALDEARAAGAERVVLVTPPDDGALREYVAGETLAERLATPGRIGAAARIEALRLDMDIVFATQPQPVGVGDAVARAAPHVLPGPVAVLLPDDLHLGSPALAEMVDRYQRCSAGHLVSIAPVEAARTARYGILDPLGGARGGFLRAVGLAEKPDPVDAPSRLAVTGRYVLHPRIFADLATLRGPRIGLSRAVERGLTKVGLMGTAPSAEWFDCSSPDGILDAAISLRERRRAAARTFSNRIGIAAE